MHKYPDFWSVIVGKGPVGFFLGFISIAFVCAAVSLLIEMANRDVSSTRTPVKFSFKFLLADNILRMFANFLVLPIAIRLIYEYIPLQWMLLVSCGIGFGVDRLAMMAQKFGILTTDKLSERVSKKISETDLIVVQKDK